MYICVLRCPGSVDGDAAGRSDVAGTHTQGGSVVHILDGSPRHDVGLLRHRAPASAAARQVEKAGRTLDAPSAAVTAMSSARSS